MSTQVRFSRGVVLLLAALTSGTARSDDAMTSTELSNYARLYHFARPALDTLDRIYRVNTRTGEMGVCVYFKPEDRDGYTGCIKASATAGTSLPSAPYRLMLAGHKDAEGVFRINLDSSDIVYCVLKDGTSLVCK